MNALAAAEALGIEVYAIVDLPRRWAFMCVDGEWFAYVREGMAPDERNAAVLEVLARIRATRH